MYYNELILKVTSCCNLNCDYCYVFNQGDKSYLEEPKFLKIELIRPILERVKEHIKLHNIKDFLIVFHGGEPLLQSKEFYKSFVQAIQNLELTDSIVLALQSNATLISQEWIDLFNDLHIQIGISIDGSRNASSHRVFRSSGKEAFDAIMRGAEIIKKNGLPLCTLSVMNVDFPAKETYNHLKTMQVDFADFLYPDITFDTKVDERLSDWLNDLFDRVSSSMFSFLIWI